MRQPRKINLWGIRIPCRVAGTGLIDRRHGSFRIIEREATKQGVVALRVVASKHRNYSVGDEAVFALTPDLFDQLPEGSVPHDCAGWAFEPQRANGGGA